jgi:hypothetical protein
MRRIMLTATALAAIALPGVASAQYYTTPYGTQGYAAPGVVVAPAAPGVVVAPAAPMVQGQVYLAPGQTYVAPGQQYSDQAIIIEGRRYYRDCWWDFGQRRCELKPWW